MGTRRRKRQVPWWGVAGVLLVMLVVIVQPWKLWATEKATPLLPGTTALPGSALEENAAESLSQAGLLERGAIFDQTLQYKPCGHVVQRRVAAPTELLGMDRKALEKALPDYRITAFGGKEVVMQREMEIFCPDHWVLKPDAQGELCVWQNRLGEEMQQMRALGIGAEDVPEEEREKVRAGKAFTSLEALEGWLESADS